MLTPKENALRMIYDEKPEYIPMTFEAFRIIGMPLAPALEAPLMQDGYDPFGVFWHVDSLGGIPDNSHFLFEDITEWKNHVKIPGNQAMSGRVWTRCILYSASCYV